ncbi:eukaryotic translation initiation factor 5A (macronuclear) [Tetrahymena thermophila SB210]|uniref:Eukaryotic translation initiation factor 5A n=1 Tax=Tetrahymena thermophila (strain SB210) TaxID=312017 RepID=Q249Q4_TETTS|nr:eukaryotic translation initiation factor 5A [Tetrahymena thermophila SB210]EAS04499.1 eukaryotic translation initiation factor 5A [Tetrahymena thermophila SB210]|eukprot:XP_001024744.1 eukaryotic translation initiation factor 5A [Tetrahymena thermophila SB210]
MSDYEHYDQGESGSSLTYPMQAGNVKKNGYAMLRGFPCRVTEMTTCKAGKHGHAKATIIGIDIFSGKKYEDSCPTSHNMEIPFVKKHEFQLIDISDDDYLTLLLENGETKEDLKLPDDEPQLVEKLRADFDSQKDILVSIISAMGQEKIISYREIVN